MIIVLNMMVIMLMIMLMLSHDTLENYVDVDVLKRHNFRRGRGPIVVLGFVLSMLAYFFTFLAIPNTANLNETNEPAFIDPNRFFENLIFGNNSLVLK